MSTYNKQSISFQFPTKLSCAFLLPLSHVTNPPFSYALEMRRFGEFFTGCWLVNCSVLSVLSTLVNSMLSVLSTLVTVCCQYLARLSTVCCQYLARLSTVCCQYLARLSQYAVST